LDLIFNYDIVEYQTLGRKLPGVFSFPNKKVRAIAGLLFFSKNWGQIWGQKINNSHIAVFCN